MLERYLGHDKPMVPNWSDLGTGTPTLAAFAHLCSHALSTGTVVTEAMLPEALAILYMARHRGVLEVKGSNDAYESPSRLLAVYVEVEDQSQIRFRDPQDARQNVLFLEGFRQLCTNGLVMHHLNHEFSLTSAGFDYARSMSAEECRHLLELGRATCEK